ncbi:hypothetical protein EV368DRAFT_67715 [Lentinula lateritia]|nr:hypothetical protein EV368DRAFT_67715 [Lentinula lateritia]
MPNSKHSSFFSVEVLHSFTTEQLELLNGSSEHPELEHFSIALTKAIEEQTNILQKLPPHEIDWTHFGSLVLNLRLFAIIYYEDHRILPSNSTKHTANTTSKPLDVPKGLRDVYDRFACHDSKTNLSSVVTHASRALDVANRGFDYEHSTDLPVGRLLNDIGALDIMENISRAALYLSLIKKGVLIFLQTYTEFQKECGIDGPLDGDDFPLHAAIAISILILLVGVTLTEMNTSYEHLIEVAYELGPNRPKNLQQIESFMWSKLIEMLSDSLDEIRRVGISDETNNFSCLIPPRHATGVPEADLQLRDVHEKEEA